MSKTNIDVTWFNFPDGFDDLFEFSFLHAASRTITASTLYMYFFIFSE